VSRLSPQQKRWAPVRKRLAKATDENAVLDALAVPGAGDGLLQDLWLDSRNTLWDDCVIRLSLKDIAIAVMKSEGVRVERKDGKFRRRRSPRMTPAAMETALVEITAVVVETPGLRCSEIASKVNLDRQRAGKLLVKLRQTGAVRSEGERAATVYFPV
jgi:hypothetical protein